MINKEIWESFKAGHTAINCLTEEEAKEFIKICDNDGIEKGNTDVMKGAPWCDYENRTCYCLGDNIIEFSPIKYFQEEDYTIKTYKELMEGNMKTYKTGDVLNELFNNNKLKFQALGLTSKEPILKFLTSTDGQRIECLSHSIAYTNDIFSDQLWILVQEPITFIEAVNSGKKIKYEKWQNFYNLHETLLELIQFNFEDQKEILTGKWYVEAEK